MATTHRSSRLRWLHDQSIVDSLAVREVPATLRRVDVAAGAAVGIAFSQLGDLEPEEVSPSEPQTDGDWRALSTREMITEEGRP